MAQKPEDYRWDSLGLRLRWTVRAGKFLYPITMADVLKVSKEEKENRLPDQSVLRLIECQLVSSIYIFGGWNRT